MGKQEKIIDTYQQIILDSEKELQRVRKQIRNISFVRLLSFAIALASVIFFWHDGWLKLTLFTITPIIIFAWLLQKHNSWFHRKDYLKKKIEINKYELEALKYNFSNFENGKEYIDPSHLYTFDLDVFGEHSLFQYLNRTSTSIGKQHLANCMKYHLKTKETIELRQEAIRELSSELEFRQEFRLLGLLYKGKASDSSEIKEWINSPNSFSKRILQILPITVGFINLISISATIWGIIPATLSGAIFTSAILLSFSFSKGITKIQNTYSQKLQILSAYANQIHLVEDKELKSSALLKIKAKFLTQDQTASHSVHQLAKLMNALDQRNNLLMSIILNGLLLWELRQIIRIEQWRSAHATDLPIWLEAIGEIDAYCSLSTFAYNHPDYIFPQIKEQPFKLEAEELGHPLMEQNKCIRNGINIQAQPSFVIITGANMAGKSTYLRTVAVNYLLGCIGTPVCATKMEFYPSQIITSLRTTDSLTDNESYFFAELKRLKLIIDKLKAGEELFIILDEILKGTNSIDKQKGSLALIKQLINLNTNGIIATHDLQLGSLVKEFPQNIQNHCFEADIIDNELNFSYKMRNGVAQNMNACFLMKKMGITVIDD